jgi:hypothetical protein
VGEGGAEVFEEEGAEVMMWSKVDVDQRTTIKPMKRAIDINRCLWQFFNWHLTLVSNKSEAKKRGEGGASEFECWTDKEHKARSIKEKLQNDVGKEYNLAPNRRLFKQTRECLTEGNRIWKDELLIVSEKVPTKKTEDDVWHENERENKTKMNANLKSKAKSCTEIE